MSYDTGAPWRDGDQCPNCGSAMTRTGKGGWLLDCRACGRVTPPGLHPEWAKIIRQAIEPCVATAHSEGFAKGVEAAAKILDGTARDAALAPIREHATKAAAAIRSLSDGGGGR